LEGWDSFWEGAWQVTDENYQEAEKLFARSLSTKYHLQPTKIGIFGYLIVQKRASKKNQKGWSSHSAAIPSSLTLAF